MAAYPYSVGGYPAPAIGSGLGTTGNLLCPPGKWSACQVRVQGIIIPDPHFPVTYVGNVGVQAAWPGFATDTAPATVVNDDVFDTGFFNAPGALAVVNAKQGRIFPTDFVLTFAYQGRAYTAQVISAQIQLTGAPAGWPGIVPPAMERITQMAPNLFFETPVFPPFEPQPPPPPVSYPVHPLGPGFSDTEFMPSGGVVLSPSDLANVPLAGAGGGSGDRFMSCMRRKGGVYSFISGIQTIPAIYCVNLPGDAEFLFFSPGLINSGGSSGQTQYGFRIYRGLNGFQAGTWNTGYKPLAQAPDYVGAGTLANLIPWQGTLQFCVEVYGLANLPASSLLDFTIQGLDT